MSLLKSDLMSHFMDTFSETRLRTTKTILFVLLCLPLAAMIFDAFGGRLVEPVEELTHRSGEWALRILLLTLAVSPVVKLTGWRKLVRLRRLLGLFSFAYMCVHFFVYLALDQGFYWTDILRDLTERPYIIAGLSCLLLCLPLAITSTNGWMKRLGGRNWKRLHKLVYFASIAAVLHFFWLIKADMTEPLIYGLILSLLLLSRMRGHFLASGFRHRLPRVFATLG